MFLLMIIAIITLIYVLCRTRYRYWEKRNIPCPKPTFPFGHAMGFLFKKENYHEFLKKIYDSSSGKRYVGAFQGLTPFLLVCDPSAVIDVTIKDHTYFDGRYIPWFARTSDVDSLNPISESIFVSEGKRWKVMRQKSVHALSSSKSRKTLLEYAVRCIEPIEIMIKESKKVDIQDICFKYVIDVVGLWVFGIECNTMIGKSSSLVDAAQFALDNNATLRFLLCAIHPKLLDILKLRDFSEKTCEFFINLTRDTIEYRKKNNIRVGDLLDTLVDIVNESANESDPNLRFSDYVIYGNMFGALLAGYESTAMTLFFTLYEITVNEDIQNKIRNEIKSVMEQHDGKLDLDTLNDLKYLDMVLLETSRKYPGDSAIFRKCTQDYVIPETSSRIEAGTIVMIPLYAFHRDPKFYPNPEKFDPERFSPDNKSSIPKGAYLGFGEGHRSCLGMKAAIAMMKIAFVKILSKYKLSPNEKTLSTNTSFVKGLIFLRFEETIYINFEKLD
nr:cytochrome P450 3633A1 [Phenacoccus solenopsis]